MSAEAESVCPRRGRGGLSIPEGERLIHDALDGGRALGQRARIHRLLLAGPEVFVGDVERREDGQRDRVRRRRGQGSLLQARVHVRGQLLHVAGIQTGLDRVLLAVNLDASISASNG